MKYDTPRPEYKFPPVIEVVMSVQFDPIESLKTPQLGALWQRFQRDFPHVEEHPPLPSAIETFGFPASPRMGFQIETSEVPFTPRVWFVSDARAELIQVQQDRFIHNWRKIDAEQTYPRYDTINPRFREELRAFIQFLEEHKIPRPQINQCEITYINHIVSGDGWQTHADLKAVISPWAGSFSDGFLPEPEDVNLNARFVIPSDNKDGMPLGRLHVNLQSAYRTADQKPIFVLSLMARGRPLDKTIEGAFAFLDEGREWIVRGFTSFTRPEMHKEVWRRTR